MLNLAKISQFVKKNQSNILLFIVIFLLILLAFGAGIVVEHQLSKPAIEITK